MKTALLSMRIAEAATYAERRSAVAHDYIVFLEKLGFLAVPVPNSAGQPERYFRLGPVHLVLLTGGNSVCRLPGDESSGRTNVFPERDTTEGILIDTAVAERIPVIGICRGFHMINVHFGGTVEKGVKGHVGRDHPLVSHLDILHGRSTNSFHNEGIRDSGVADPLEVLARSEDGWVEACRHRRFPILGLQWHPERQQRDFDVRLIEAFLQHRL